MATPVDQSSLREFDCATPGTPEPLTPHQQSLIAELVRRYRLPLLTFFQNRVISRQEAEDLTQEVFLRLVRRVGAGGLEIASGYIFTVASNLLRDRGRRESASATESHVAIDDATNTEVRSSLVNELEAERLMLSRETLGRVLGALDHAGERTRDIFVLFRLEGVRQRDIAETFGISVSAVEKHIVKAVRAITAALADHDV